MGSRRLRKIRWTDHVKKYYNESRKKGTSYMRQNKGKVSELAKFCIGTEFYITLLKEKWRGHEDEEKDVSDYWMALTFRHRASFV